MIFFSTIILSLIPKRKSFSAQWTTFLIRTIFREIPDLSNIILISRILKKKQIYFQCLFSLMKNLLLHNSGQQYHQPLFDHHIFLCINLLLRVVNLLWVQSQQSMNEDEIVVHSDWFLLYSSSLIHTVDQIENRIHLNWYSLLDCW